MKLFAFIAIVTTIFSCGDTETCPRYFHLPITLTPVKTTYRVGDTIAVVSKFHRSTPALNSENKPAGCYDMAGINWLPNTLMYNTDSIGSLTSVFNSCFKYLKDENSNYDLIQFSQTYFDLKGEYVFERDSFYLAYKMICLKPGNYLMFSRSDIVTYTTGTQDYPGKCNGVGFDVYFSMNGSADNNIDLLKESPDPHWNTWLVSQEKNNRLFSNLGGYCIKVVP